MPTTGRCWSTPTSSLLEQIRHRLPGLEHVVVLDSKVPETTLPGVIPYEELIADQPAHYPPLDIPERTPLGLCYTSGTTGRPKAAEYTHRSTFLHSLAVTSAAGMRIGPADSVLPQVPMFHANAWGMPFASCLAGAKQVYFAGALEPAPFVDLLMSERVTISAGVPTVWLTVARSSRPPEAVCPTCATSWWAGASRPGSLITHYLDELGLQIVQAWGMTETSPLASVAWPQERMREWDERADHRRGPGAGGPASSRHLGERSATTTVTRCPSTAPPWATCTSAAPGSSTATCMARGPRTSARTDGSRPATWPSAHRAGTSSSPTGPRTSSSRAASGSPR